MLSGNQISVIDKIIAAGNTLRDKPAEEIREQLIFLVNELLNTDFHALIQLLYRIDVDEEKLKQLMEVHKGIDPASIIADLIIARQLQKIATRQQFSGGKESRHEDGC